MEPGPDDTEPGEASEDGVFLDDDMPFCKSNDGEFWYEDDYVPKNAMCDENAGSFLVYSDDYDIGDRPILAMDLDIPHEEIKDYPEGFDHLGVVRLYEVGCPPEVAEQYLELGFNGVESSHLYNIGIEPAEIEKSARNIDLLVQILALIEQNYRQRLDEFEDNITEELGEPRIVWIDRNGRIVCESNNTFKEEKHKQSKEILDSKQLKFAFMEDDLQGPGEMRPRFNPDYRKMLMFENGDIIPLGDSSIGSLGSGNHSFVLHDRQRAANRALKFGWSDKLSHEADLLEKVKAANRTLCNVVEILDYKSVIELEDSAAGFSVISLERLDGETLEDFTGRGYIPCSEVIKAGRFVLNGLIEMRRAGVYHRDLHTKNVIVDSDPESPLISNATIIDLEAASDDPTKIHRLNRAYGGNNDLISLGLLMYKMATGRNLFNEGENFTCYSAVKEGIKTLREDTYDSSEKKAAMLCRVKAVLKDQPLLADIITDLLDDDLWTQPAIDDVEEVVSMFGGIYRER